MGEQSPSKPIVVGLGEVLWDIFPNEAHFGGAPANFACHAAALGAESWIVSAVGQDDLGTDALAKLRAIGVHTEAIQIVTGPTGTVHVELDAQKQASYRFADHVAWDQIGLDARVSRLATCCDAVCFGTLAQRDPQSRHTIHHFLDVTRADALRVFDINLRQQFYDEAIIRASLGAATLLKLNSDELPVLLGLLKIAAASEVDALETLCACFDLRGAALTRGSQGSLLLWEGELNEQPPIKLNPVDTVGAGDAFTAALVLGLLRGSPLSEVHRHASTIARYVCTQAGATPTLPPNLMPSV
jgi:fructokinase